MEKLFSPEPVPATLVARTTHRELARRLLEHLHRARRTQVTADAVGISRFALRRILSGECEPTVTVFLQLLDHLTFRMLDFLSAWVDPAALPSVADRWRQTVAHRDLAYREPFAEAVLLAVTLDDYRALPRHREGWISHRLGIGLEIEQRCIDALKAAGLLRWNGRRYVETQRVAVDTRANFDLVALRKRAWIEEATSRMGPGDDRLFSYNVFTCSRDDWEAVRDLCLAFYDSLRERIAQGDVDEQVGLFCLQLVPLAGAEEDPP